jgi:hypothetical protein
MRLKKFPWFKYHWYVVETVKHNLMSGGQLDSGINCVELVRLLRKGGGRSMFLYIGQSGMGDLKFGQ